MKLICETVEDVQVIKEAREDGKKDYYIEGIFLQGDIKNRNGRMYPSQTLAKEVARYTKESINQNRAYGELNHPQGPSINLDRVSHMIKELRQDGSNFIGKAKIMTETPMGKIVKNLIDEGANLGVSSRGLGTLKANGQGIMEVQNDFMLATAADVVADPSAPEAYVRGVMESADWLFDAASGSWRAIDHLERSKKFVSEASLSQIAESKLRLFESFLNKLSQK